MRRCNMGALKSAHHAFCTGHSTHRAGRGQRPDGFVIGETGALTGWRGRASISSQLLIPFPEATFPPRVYSCLHGWLPLPQIQSGSSTLLRDFRFAEMSGVRSNPSKQYLAKPYWARRLDPDHGLPPFGLVKVLLSVRQPLLSS
jgi:hypothetical protein